MQRDRSIMAGEFPKKPGKSIFIHLFGLAKLCNFWQQSMSVLLCRKLTD